MLSTVDVSSAHQNKVVKFSYAKQKVCHIIEFLAVEWYFQYFIVCVFCVFLCLCTLCTISILNIKPSYTDLSSATNAAAVRWFRERRFPTTVGHPGT